MRRVLVSVLSMFGLTLLVGVASAGAASEPPLRCEARPNGAGGFDVSWSPASTVQERYIVYRSVDGAGPYWRHASDQGDASYTARLFADSGLPAGTAVVYEMRGKETATATASGAVICDWVTAASGVAVEVLSNSEISAGGYTPGQGAVDISWTPDPTADGFRIVGERREFADDVDPVSDPAAVDPTGVRVVDVAAGASSVVIDDLDEWFWSWTVEALFDARIASATTPTPVAALAAPVAGGTDHADGTGTVAWTADLDAGGYNVFVNGSFTAWNAAWTSYPVTTTGTTTIGVQATAAGNLQSATTEVALVVTDTFAAPTITSVDRTGTSQIQIIWNEADGAVSYTIERETSLSQAPPATATVATGLGAPLSTYTETAVPGGFSTWTVTAVSNSGRTATSSPVAAVTAPAVAGAANPDQTVTLTWDHQNQDDGIVGYNLFTNGTYTAWIGLGTPNGSHTTTALAPGDYTFTLEPSAGNNILGVTATTPTVTVVDPAPATPTGLNVTNTPDSAEVVFAWNAAANAATYRIDVVLPGGGTNTYTTTNLSVPVSDLALTTPGYSATVTALNANQVASPASAPVTFATRPAAVASLTATQNSTAIDLSWPRVDGAAGYHIRRINNNGSTTYIDWHPATTNPTQTFTITNPGPDGDYQYQVQATANALDGVARTASNTVTFDTTPPAAPTGLSVTGVTTSSLDIAWNPVGDAASYTITLTQAGVTIDTATTTQSATTFTNLDPDTTYTITVVANDAAGNTSTPTTTTSTTDPAPDTERPSAPPTPVVVSSDNGEVVLELADNGDLPDPGGSGVAQFEVLRNTTNADNNFTVIATVTRDGVTTTFPDDTVSVGATYYYALKAIDAAGNTSFRSGYTNPVTVTVSGPPATPAAPSVTSDGDGTLTITWDAVAGADSYDIYRDVAENIATGDPANWPNPVGTVTHPTTTWPDPKVFPNGTTHTYRIVASNNAGSSTMSNKGTGTVTNSIWSTALNNNTGQWEIRNPQGQAVQWEAVNVRSYDFAEAPLDGTDIAALAERFNYIRLNLSWQRLQPDNSGPIDAQNGQAEADRVMLFLSRLSTYNTQNPNNQVHVILDFAHLADSKNQFQIPTWAWNAGRAEAAAVGVNFTGTPANRSWYAWAGVDQTGSRVASYIDALADYGIFDHETVIAVEFMNEPHPRNGNVQTAATQGELATVYGNLVDHIRTSTNPDIDNETLIVLGAFFGGTRFGGTIDANGDFQHNAMATEFAGESNLIWTAHSYYTGYGDILRGGDARNDGQFNDGRRGGDGWAENPETDAGCYSDVLRSVDLLPFAWDCAGGFPNRSAAQLGLRNTAYWNQDYAQQAGMPFFLGEWGVPRQRFQVVNGVGGYRGIDGSELYFCDAMAAFEDPNNDGNTNDRISWAVWSFDARVDGFGLYMSQSQSLIGRDFLTANQWVDTGEFNSNQQAWENYNPNGDDWNYAQPFDPDDPVNGCRQ